MNGDVREVHAEMKAAEGEKNVWIVGGGDLAGQFYDAGLLDEMIVQVVSATLGKGKPQLMSVRQMGAGMAELRYEG